MGSDLIRKLAREQTRKIFFRKLEVHPRRKAAMQSGLDCTYSTVGGGERDIADTGLVVGLPSVAWTSGAEGNRRGQSGLL